MPVKAVIFDLDGTLLDSIDDLADSANEFLRNHGFRQHSSDAYKLFIGNGVERLMRDILPVPVDDEKVLLSYADEYKKIYRKNYLNKTKPFSGILPMLDECVRMGISIAVLSNKPDAMTHELVKHFFSGYPFAHIQGARPNEMCKPDPGLATSIASKLGFEVEEVCCVGDSDVDMRMAEMAGMTSVGVLWGFRSREELERNNATHIIERASDLIDILKRAGG
jgi:phosphoglycolate phosphatase